MMKLAGEERFAASISYHTGTVAILPPYTIPGVRSPEPNVNELVAREISAGITTHPEGRLPVRKNLYPVDGTDQDWLFATFGTLALLVEGVDNGARPQSQRRQMVEAVRKSWQLLIARFLDGPSISGRVTRGGQPVEAQVVIDEIVTHEGEVWTTRARDGRFDRFVPKRGRYTVRVILDDAHDVTRAIEVQGRAHVDIALP